MFTRYNTQKPNKGIQLRPDRHWSKDGLVGLWLMNEGGGNIVNDLSGNGYNATSGTYSWISGNHGSAIYGTNSGPTVSAPGWDFDKFTVIGCIAPMEDDSDNGIISIFSGNNGFIVYLRQNFAPKRFQIYLGDGDSNSYDYTSCAPVVNKFDTYALTFDNGSIKYYINGEYIDSDSMDETHADCGSVDAKLGSAGGVFDYQKTDYVYLYNRALTANEIAYLYRNPFCMFERDDIVLWQSGGVKVYSSGDVAALPGDDSDMENAFTSTEYDQVSEDDADRVTQSATGEFAAFLFKDRHTGQDTIHVHWNGQTDRAPTLSTVYLQIYNRDTTTWETLDSDSTTGADTDFDLYGNVTSNLDDYFDSNYEVACRVYQESK